MTRDIATTEQALSRLAPIARDIAAGAGRDGGTWLVGGVVRDAFLERPLLDLDVIVDGDCGAAARSLARARGGTAFRLSDRFGCWRVAVGEGPDQQQIDVCELRDGSLEHDLALRDFTVNAMAVDCHDTGSEALVDPLGGRADLADRLVRAVSDRAFDDDPLRMLRAARIAHTLDMHVDGPTRALARSRAARAVEPSGERTFAELCMLVLAPEARRAMRLLDELGLIEHLLPELHGCRGVEQSRYHHLDVFEHTLAVLDNCEDVLASPLHYLGDPPGCEVPPVPGEWQLTARFAALCHDLGKPATRAVDEATGRISFVGHDVVGVDIVDAMCDRWATSNRFRDSVRLLVRTHLALGMLLHEPIDARACYRFLRRVEPCAPQAIVLSVADRLATAGVDDRRRWVRLHVTAAHRLWTAWWLEQRDGHPEPLLDGMRIATEAGIEPGPQLGQLVRALAEEQAIGAVADEAEAVEFVRRHAAEMAGARER